jgi:protein-tyrosine phosphatase
MPEDPDRLLPLQGASNFRDLGGYRGHGGRPLRWRRLFRSDHLARLTPDDRATLADLGVARAFDFRGVHERAAEPYGWPGLAQHSLAIEPTVAQRIGELAAGGHALSAERMRALMHELYRRLVTHEAARFAEWFGHLLADDRPLVFHCTAGKDRTGIAAALLLRALGVADSEVEADYLLTNVYYRAPPVEAGVVPVEALQVLWSVQPGFLHTAFAIIDEEHGGIERYLAEKLALDDAARERLSALYLESDPG